MSEFKKWMRLFERAVDVALSKLELKHTSKTEKKKKYYKEAYTYSKAKSAYEIKSDFANYLLILTSEVMKADGKILKSELNFVKTFFKNQFSPSFAQVRIKMLQSIVKESYDIRKATLNIKEVTPLSQRKYLLQYLFRLAKADGAITREEINIIDLIAETIGYAGTGYEDLKRKFIKIAEKNEYAILGIKVDATDSEVKKAYRSLAREHHPDKFSEATKKKAAGKKFNQINEAYELIKKTRGFK